MADKKNDGKMSTKEWIIFFGIVILVTLLFLLDAFGIDLLGTGSSTALLLK